MASLLASFVAIIHRQDGTALLTDNSNHAPAFCLTCREGFDELHYFLVLSDCLRVYIVSLALLDMESTAASLVPESGHRQTFSPAFSLSIGQLPVCVYKPHATIISPPSTTMNSIKQLLAKAGWLHDPQGPTGFCLTNLPYNPISQPIALFSDRGENICYDVARRLQILRLKLVSMPDQLPYLRPGHMSVTAEIIYAACGLWVLWTLVTYLSTFLRARRYRHFTQNIECGPARALPRPFLANLRHKLLLLTYQGGDLLDGFFVEKYRKYGPTHALHNQFGMPIVIHTTDPQNMLAILSNSWTNWRPSQNRTNSLKPLAQEGLLLTEVSTQICVKLSLTHKTSLTRCITGRGLAW